MSAAILAAAFLIVSWAWAAYFRECSATNLALWAIATFMVADKFM